jgi:methyltransferase (TIGR00027 family)
MASISNVTGTAFVVAEFLAQENGEVDPLYRDTVVELFLNGETKQAAALVAASFSTAKDLVRIRTKYFDDKLDAQILAHCRQVVILGAGLDTRAARKPAPGVTYFEIDDAATLKLKQMSYEQRHIDVNVRFIPGNYVTDGLIDLLKQNDFDFNLPTFLIWEGNTMYLPLDSSKHMLTQLKKYVKRFRLSFDYMAKAVISNTTGDTGITNLIGSFANMGAPWISGISDIQGFARELSLTVVENFKTAQLYRTYWPWRVMASSIFHFYSVCTLENR